MTIGESVFDFLRRHRFFLTSFHYRFIIADEAVVVKMVLVAETVLLLYSSMKLATLRT